MADFAKMEEIRARVDSIVTDPATAEALKPWYGYFCKRPCFHDEYLQTFNRDNVTLVDTRGMGVERITADGVVVDGAEHDVDCLIFATGFEVGTDYSRRTGFEIVGRDGRRSPTSGATAFGPFTACTSTVSRTVSCCQHRPVGLHRELPVSAGRAGAPHRRGDRVGAEQRRHASSRRRPRPKRHGSTRSSHGPRRAPSGPKSCTPGYYNREGQANAKTRQGSFFFGSPTEYADILEASRAQRPPDGFEIRTGIPRDAARPIPHRSGSGADSSRQFAASGDHRRRLRRTCRSGRVAAQRHR